MVSGLAVLCVCLWRACVPHKDSLTCCWWCAELTHNDLCEARHCTCAVAPFHRFFCFVLKVSLHCPVLLCLRLPWPATAAVFNAPRLNHSQVHPAGKHCQQLCQHQHHGHKLGGLRVKVHWHVHVCNSKLLRGYTAEV